MPSMLTIARSDKSLKSRNQPMLITFIIANAIGIALVLIGTMDTAQLVRDLSTGNAAALPRLIGIPTGASLALGLLGWVVPARWKETLVFWRVGVRRLPSSEAFTKIAPSDLRINVDALVRHLGTLPMDYRQQSATWYATYRKHAKEMAVTDANGAYLLYREMAALAAMLLPVTVVTGGIIHATLPRLLAAGACICFEYLLVTLAARNAGTRLVGNVLAIESAELSRGAPITPKKRASRKNSEPSVD